MATRTATRTGASPLGIVVDPAAYRRIVYLLLSFPLGMAYFLALSLGLSLGAGLAVVGVGIPILLGTLLSVRAMLTVELWRARALLGVDVEAPDWPGGGDGILAWTRRTVGSETVWRAVGALLFTFAFGIAGFAVTVTLLALSLSTLTAPLHYHRDTLQFVVWEPATLVDGLALVPVGAVLFVLALHACNRLALAGGGVLASLLDA